MFAVTFILLGITLITGIIAYGSPESAASTLLQMLFPPFGALFVIALALSIGSQAGGRRAS